MSKPVKSMMHALRDSAPTTEVVEAVDARTAEQLGFLQNWASQWETAADNARNQGYTRDAARLDTTTATIRGIIADLIALRAQVAALTVDNNAMKVSLRDSERVFLANQFARATPAPALKPFLCSYYHSAYGGRTSIDVLVVANTPSEAKGLALDEYDLTPDHWTVQELELNSLKLIAISHIED